MTIRDESGLSKVCVILGAGASHDVRNEANDIINEVFQPPLVSDLFDFDAHPEYRAIARRYSGAITLSQSIAPKARSREFNLEAELTRLASHPSTEIREHFKHVPAYLRDLLQKASDGYTTEPGCYAQLVAELLAESSHDVMFLVLNYDTLLEKAITGFKRNWQFAAIGDYVRNDGRPKVVKLHGSVNWFKNLGALGNRGWQDYVQEVDVLSKPPENGIEVLSPGVDSVSNPVAQIIIGRNWVYPVLTAPLAGKGIADAVCPASHIEAAKDFLGECRKFLIVGTSGLDDDLLSLLNDSVSPTLRPRPAIQLVGVEDAEQALVRFERGVQAFRGRRITPPGSLHTRGFREYIRSGELSRFAAFDPRRNQ